jgi:hypothetical protein
MAILFCWVVMEVYRNSGGMHSAIIFLLMAEVYSGNGFHGLQVTEVSGMYVNSRGNYDMYFATQDNDLFASEDMGRNWNFNTQWEGFFLGTCQEGCK